LASLRRRAWAIAACCLFTPGLAFAIDPFELQVYDANITPKGQFGLELHSNYTFSGRKTPSYSGELVPDGAFRVQFEPTYGAAEWLELGLHAYTWVSSEGNPDFGGVMIRGLFVVPPESTAPFFFGIKAELGWVTKAISEEAWDQEFRFVLGYSDRVFLAVINPIVGWPLQGSTMFRPEFEPSAKLAIDTQAGFSLGFEHFSSLGAFSDGFDSASEQQHLFFSVLDLTDKQGVPPPFALNIGVGRGLTDATHAKWIAKAVVGFNL
jgi:hypothetical protein